MASQGTSSRRSRRTKCNSIYRRDSAPTNGADENKLDRASPPLSFGSIDQITKTLSGLNITDKPVNSQETEPNQQAAQTPTPSICHELQETETNITIHLANFHHILQLTVQHAHLYAHMRQVIPTLRQTIHQIAETHGLCTPLDRVVCCHPAIDVMYAR